MLLAGIVSAMLALANTAALEGGRCHSNAGAIETRTLSHQRNSKAHPGSTSSQRHLSWDRPKLGLQTV